jgi:nicotianamine synthase
MSVVDDVVVPVSDAVARVHRELERRSHLRPCREVDALFGELVGLVVALPPGAPPPVRGHRAAALRRLCAEGEDQLERAWARRICRAHDPVACLAGFPYADNYRRLVRLELDTVARVASRPVRHAVFLGAGALPLSALMAAAALEVAVDAVDRDREASDTGRQVAAALGADGVRFVAGDASTLEVAAYDLVVVAALVGATCEAKRALLARLATAMAPGATLLARGARSARTLLYPPVDLDGLAGFAVQAVVHPVDDVVNSVVVATAVGSG